MTEFDKIDTDKSGSIDRKEWDALELEDKRRRLDDEDSKRDQQRRMVWFALGGMLLYPFSIIATSIGGLSEATSALSSIAGVYFVSVAGIVGVFFGVTNVKPRSSGND
tara:strand:+ start:779 stop:1102 length:324 start_codon:yes stop_codon:yes gene_type:complete